MTTTTDHRVGVVIVTYNSAKFIRGLLNSLADASRGLNVTVIVVDNGSTDDTLDIVRTWDGVSLVSSGGNVGYSAAINLGSQFLPANSHIAVLNPDLVLQKDALTRLVGALAADPSIGIATPRLLNPDGTTFHHLRREPSLTRLLGDSLLGDRWSTRPGWLSEPIRGDYQYENPVDVDWAGGAALAISAECRSRLGDWDSASYFLYAEETDYAARARDRGFRVHYVPGSLVVHHGGGSGTSPALTALMSLNRLRYYRSRHGRVATACFRAALIFHHSLRVRRDSDKAALSAVVRDPFGAHALKGDLAAPTLVFGPAARVQGGSTPA